MLIIGERINTSRKAVNEAVEKRDAVFVAADVQRQVKAGADYIDVNAGIFVGKEPEYLRWLVKTVQTVVDCP
ncbi:MAG: methyltetrahydrofolate cobalamin methyltransferase, partial [Deltaproteobacteria bacterium]|nr:methyltetrahydrofolate cobalamin methyltransferase [Deltaproteobacteria bacterium]